MVGETATVYTWYYGDVTVDPETLEVSGEALDQTSSDPEVTVENGVSTFHVTDFDKPLTCAPPAPRSIPCLDYFSKKGRRSGAKTENFQ